MTFYRNILGITKLKNFMGCFPLHRGPFWGIFGVHFGVGSSFLDNCCGILPFLEGPFRVFCAPMRDSYYFFMIFCRKLLGIMMVMLGTFLGILVQCGVCSSYLMEPCNFSFNFCAVSFFFENITFLKNSFSHNWNWTQCDEHVTISVLLNWSLFFTFALFIFILAGDEQRYSQFFHKVYDHGKGWLDCVQRRLGLPYWFLCFVLMLSFFLITWVCCSSCDDDCRHKETAKVSETVFEFSNIYRHIFLKK